MKRTTKRLLALLLCLAVLPVEGFAALAKDKVTEPPAYMRELSRLVAATASDSDFGEIQLTIGEPEMEVDGETQPITDDESVAPFVDENNELQIPVEVIDEADLNGSGFLSAEEMKEQGYDVQTDDSTGTVIITEPYQQCRLIVKTTDGKVRVTRRGKLLFTGPIATIRHFKETVKEVKQAQECGILLDGFGDFEEGDVLECFAFEELPKSL